MSKDLRRFNFAYAKDIEGYAKQFLIGKGFTIVEETDFLRSSLCYDIIAEKDGIKYAINVKGTRTGKFSITQRNVMLLQIIPDCKAAFLFMQGNKSIGFFVCSNDAKTKETNTQRS